MKMTMKMMKIPAHSSIDSRGPALAILAVACLAIASQSIRAADLPANSEPVKTTVTFGDLNLGHSEGVEQLYRRIAGAAQRVCGSLDGRSVRENLQFSVCLKQSIARAVAAVDQPALTALQATKTGRQDVMIKLANR